MFSLCSAATALSTYQGSSEGTKEAYSTTAETVHVHDDELFLACMRRFLYTRCYNSIEFLSALKVSTEIIFSKILLTTFIYSFLM